MIAIDLDGTLLNQHVRISQRNIDAVKKAQDAGVLIVPCTGRAWRESIDPLDGMPPPPVGIFVNGAVVTEISSAESLNLVVMDPGLVSQVIEILYNEPEAVLVFREGNLAGYDYLVTGGGELASNSTWWFRTSNARVHYLSAPSTDDLLHCLRISIVAVQPRIVQIIDRLDQKYGPQLSMHHFPAVQLPSDREVLHVLEIFNAGVDKWRGINWIAERHQIDIAEIATIGDQVNDLAMIQNAGCSIAMGNAVESIKAAADYITFDNESDGVAHAIDHVLDGVWG